MQTFLPSPSFKLSASYLDNKRLGKQRVEAYQILCCLSKHSSTGWKNHPAVRMWEFFPPHLMEYIDAICDEWTSRGFQDSVKEKAREVYLNWNRIVPERYPEPFWLNSSFNDSHQSNLVRKDPIYYRQHFPSVPDNLPYLWPVYITEINLAWRREIRDD